MEKVTLTDLRRRISWGSVIAGVVTVLAISILLSILGSSVGLYMIDPTSSSPMSGVGTTVGIWTVVSLLISLFCGGYVAGKLAGEDGIIHGFLVWATTLIITAILTIMLAVSAVKFTANMLGSVATVAGNVVSGVGSAVGDGVSDLTDQVGDIFSDIDIDTDSDSGEVKAEIRQALRKSGVRELQPEYLQREMKGVKSDLERSVKRLMRNPNDADNVINSFMERLKARGEKFAQNIDRDDLTRAIANNSNMSKAEVERAVDEYIELINRTKENAKEQIHNLEQTIEQAKQDLEATKQKALVEAEKATNTAATSGLISFFALLIGAGLCSFAGLLGIRRAHNGYQI